MILIAQFSCGLLYLNLGEKLKWAGSNLREFVEKGNLSVAYVTLMRYMTLATVLLKYPQLLPCQLNFTQLLKHKTRLLKYMSQKDGHELNWRLSAPFDVIANSHRVQIRHDDIITPAEKFNTSPDWAFHDMHAKSETIDKDVQVVLESRRSIDEEAELNLAMKKMSPGATPDGMGNVKAPRHWDVDQTDLYCHYQTVKVEAERTPEWSLDTGHGQDVLLLSTQPSGSFTCSVYSTDTRQLSPHLPGHHQYFELSKKTPSIAMQREFAEIESLFCDSMPSTVSVVSIERIENGDLWLNYDNKRARMEKKLAAGKTVGGRRLFHGTKASLVDAICKQGFDFRLSGTSTGTMFGKGSYFAVSASKASQYTTDNVMFVVQVLVGDYAKGNHTYVRPPKKNKDDPISDLYDSCVDNVDNPKIFVIFDNNGQVYPEYIIRYEMKY